MLISPSKISFKPILLQSKPLSNLPKLKTLNKDTVSFGYIDAPEPPKDLQLYRCIGESELNALLEGKTMEHSKYATSDPKGWQANDWHNGFNSRKGKIYYITFKTGSENIDIRDRRDSLEDTRYGVGAYNLDNIQNIRKGHNAHGELVWAEDFENAKKSDKENKLKEIERLRNDLKELLYCKPRCNSEIEKICDELGSYANEFPEIIDGLKPLLKNDNQCLNMLLGVISDADRPEDWQFVQNELQNFSDNGIRVDNIYLVDYIKKHASDEDVPIFLDIAKNDPNARGFIGNILKKIATQKSHSMIKEAYLSGDEHTQYNLIYYFEDKEDRADIARLTLEKYKKQQDEILNIGDYRNSALISECIQILEKHGSKDDISLLEEYAKESFSYANGDAVIAINKLKMEK